MAPSDANSNDKAKAPPASSLEASLPDPDSMLLPDADESFELQEPAGEESDPTVFVKPKKGEDSAASATNSASDSFEPQYILGTLVVRVVAARDLEPVQKGGLAQMVFGNNRSSAKKRPTGGTANPYASVKFGGSTQRTSQVYDTLDPIWPRQETMFMDVSLPLSKVHHPRPMEIDPASKTEENQQQQQPAYTYTKPQTVLTVALFHSAELGKVNKMNKGFSGDSNDMFMGMASLDLQRLFTGKDHVFDGWLRLSGTENSKGSVRLFRIAQVIGDQVTVEYTTAEGWVCTFMAHRYMLLCEQRHHTTVEAAQDELASLAERLSHSPLVDTLNHSVERVAVDGILTVGEDAVKGTVSLFNRWFSGGIDTIIGDVSNVTNWDGRYNPNVEDGLGLPNVESDGGDNEAAQKPAASDPINESYEEAEALPNMPACPITGEPMIDPVVAADGKYIVSTSGHTYERKAIARWLATSNKSPMTGSILPHKELVPNYGLMSSVQEAAEKAQREGVQPDIPLKVEVNEVASLGISLVPSMETISISAAPDEHGAPPAPSPR
eukprot:Nitzschia sp. Nitz4//scaffold128_size63911//57374//59346//NITZ4_006232-RA/size63911-augustus-gene-0.106-mRNA-1//-1//CDS//3329534871//7515//frame0